MNILDVYKEFHHQFIVVFSCMSEIYRRDIGKYLSSELSLKLIDMSTCIISDYNETKTLPNGKTVINYDSDSIIDWMKLNKLVNDEKHNGVVVVGQSFPDDKIDFKIDYHVHLQIKKKELTDKYLEYLKTKKPDIDTETETLKVSVLTYPYYFDTLKKMKIDYFIKQSENDDIKKLNDDIFNKIIKHIELDIYSSDNKMNRIKLDKKLKHPTDSKKDNPTSEVTSTIDNTLSVKSQDTFSTLSDSNSELSIPLTSKEYDELKSLSDTTDYDDYNISYEVDEDA